MGQKSDREASKMLNEAVLKLLKAGTWDLATCADGEPNVVPVAFKDVTEEGKLVVGGVFLETTLHNLQANNGRIAFRCTTPRAWRAIRSRGPRHM